MNVAEIQSRLDAMPAAMNAKGKVDPEARVSLRSDAEPTVAISWRKTDPDAGRWDRDNHYCEGENLAMMLDVADRVIYQLPSIEEARMAEFTAKLASVIELGRTVGIDPQYVNPLLEAMKRLSENAITDQSK